MDRLKLCRRRHLMDACGLAVTNGRSERGNCCTDTVSTGFFAHRDSNAAKIAVEHGKRFSMTAAEGPVRLKGSSMIEVIVASLIFLAVFAISLSTITGLTLRRDEVYVLLEAERALEELSRSYGNGTRAEGTYTDAFDWGGITTVVADYEGYENIQCIVLRAHLNSSHKTFEHRQLVRKDGR